MTAIAYRDGIMAADTAVWRGDTIIGYRQKIRRLRDGRLFAACGETSLAVACFEWLDGRGERPNPLSSGEFGGLLVAKHKLERVCADFRVVDVTLICEFLVDGAHIELMFGAMMMGASAEQAVELAIRHGCYAGGDVQVERV